MTPKKRELFRVYAAQRKVDDPDLARVLLNAEEMDWLLDAADERERLVDLVGDVGWIRVLAKAAEDYNATHASGPAEKTIAAALKQATDWVSRARRWE